MIFRLFKYHRLTLCQDGTRSGKRSRERRNTRRLYMNFILKMSADNGRKREILTPWQRDCKWLCFNIILWAYLSGRCNRHSVNLLSLRALCNLDNVRTSQGFSLMLYFKLSSYRNRTYCCGFYFDLSTLLHFHSCVSTLEIESLLHYSW